MDDDWEDDGKTHDNWIFTLNNPHKYPRDLERLQNPPPFIKYYEYEPEHFDMPGKTPHYQGWAHRWGSGRLASMKKFLYHARWKPMYGTVEQNMNYCNKENKVIKWGDPPIQGRRTDIITVKRKIDEDPTKAIWDLADENEYTFKTVMKNYRALGEYARHKLRKLHLTMKHKPLVYIFYGPSRTGKSEWLANQVGVENVATMPPPTSTWWIDEYVARSKYLLVDEITSQRVPPIDMFLGWCDKLCKPYNIKGGSSTMRPEIIVFTSNLHPGLWWSDMDVEHIQAVCERMTGGIYRTRKDHEPHLEFKWGEGFKAADFYSEAEADAYRQWYYSGTSHIKATP